MIQLLKKINGNLEVVDYGCERLIGAYIKRGYTVRKVNGNPYINLNLRKEFEELWASLPASEQIRLHDIRIDDEMTTEERIVLLKAEIATRARKRASVVKPVYVQKKITLSEQIKSDVSYLYNAVKSFFTFGSNLGFQAC